MKKVLLLVFAAIFLIGLTGCGETTVEDKFGKITSGMEKEKCSEIMGYNRESYYDGEKWCYIWENEDGTGAGIAIIENDTVLESYWQDGDKWIKEKEAINEINEQYDFSDYLLVNSSTYIRDGKECIGYRVVVDERISNKDIAKVFVNITYDDNYHLHTVWFYRSAEEVTNGAYTLALFEEVGEDAELESSFTDEYTASSYTAERQKDKAIIAVIDSYKD